jgi:hypothetical protein
MEYVEPDFLLDDPDSISGTATKTEAWTIAYPKFDARSRSPF